MDPERASVGIGGGQRLPIVGLGTWNVTGDDVEPAAATALECGYRHIDTAYGYGNEAGIGQALRSTGLDREEVFLTSKIPPRRIGYEGPAAGRGGGGARGDDGSGAGALAASARNRRAPPVGARGPDQGELRRMGFRADPGRARAD
jgi:aryl-alcohol dehydrogenase-like predicted oxidoreductase